MRAIGSNSSGNNTVTVIGEADIVDRVRAKENTAYFPRSIQPASRRGRYVRRRQVAGGAEGNEEEGRNGDRWGGTGDKGFIRGSLLLPLKSLACCR